MLCLLWLVHLLYNLVCNKSLIDSVWESGIMPGSLSFFAEHFYWFADLTANWNFPAIHSFPMIPTICHRSVIEYYLGMNPFTRRIFSFPLPNDGIAGSLGSILGMGIIFVISDRRGVGSTLFCVVMSLKRYVRAANGRVARPKPTSFTDILLSMFKYHSLLSLHSFMFF